VKCSLQLKPMLALHLSSCGPQHSAQVATESLLSQILCCSKLPKSTSHGQQHLQHSIACCTPCFSQILQGINAPLPAATTQHTSTFLGHPCCRGGEWATLSAEVLAECETAKLRCLLHNSSVEYNALLTEPFHHLYATRHDNQLLSGTAAWAT
jgi:hypothetical protein